MLKSCQYCGRIHDTKKDCGKKPQRGFKTNPNDKDKFRWTTKWQNKRNEIKDRDFHTCQICIRKLYDYKRQYETDDLSVHHAIPLEQNFEKRLDNDNLLTLCQEHHELAEKGSIPYKLIKKIIMEQEEAKR